MRLHLCLVGDGKFVAEKDIRVRTLFATLAAKIASAGCKIQGGYATLHRDDRLRTVTNACAALCADLFHGTYETRWRDAESLPDLSAKEGAP